MAHVHLIDGRFHIRRATDTGAQRHQREPSPIERVADIGCPWAQLNADRRPMIRLPMLPGI
jgi:hypothetical protein